MDNFDGLESFRLYSRCTSEGIGRDSKLAMPSKSFSASALMIGESSGSFRTLVKTCANATDAVLLLVVEGILATVTEKLGTLNWTGNSELDWVVRER